jgi:hypothetical protein
MKAPLDWRLVRTLALDTTAFIYHLGFIRLFRG